MFDTNDIAISTSTKTQTYIVMLIERYTSTGYSDRTDNTTDWSSAW